MNDMDLFIQMFIQCQLIVIIYCSKFQSSLHIAKWSVFYRDAANIGT